MSLPSPLIASDEWVKPRDISMEAVRITAGLHRQVWVSGTTIYVDVHIVNNSRKAVKKIELQVERDLLCYKHVCSSGSIVMSLRMLMPLISRPLQLPWRNQQARRAYSTVTKDLYSVNQ